MNAETVATLAAVEADAQIAHDALCRAIARVRTLQTSGRIYNLYLDLNGCAGTLDRILKVGECSALARRIAS